MQPLVHELNSGNDNQLFMPIGGILNRSYSIAAKSSSIFTHFLPAKDVSDIEKLAVNVTIGKKKVSVIPAISDDVSGICALNFMDIIDLFCDGYYDRNAEPKTTMPLPSNCLYFISYVDLITQKYQPESIRSVNDMIFCQVDKPAALESIVKSAKKTSSSVKKTVEFSSVQTPVATTVSTRGQKDLSSAGSNSSGCTSVDTASTYSVTSSGGNVSVSMSPLAIDNSLINTDMKFISKPSPRPIAVNKVLHRVNGPSNYNSQSQNTTIPPNDRWSQYWSALKSVGWHLKEFKHDEIVYMEMYISPLSVTTVKSAFENGIENLNYFVSKNAMMDLIDSNHCYDSDFKLWEILQKHGWVSTPVTFKEAKGILKQVDPQIEFSEAMVKDSKLFTYKYVPPASKKNAWTPIIGLHIFNNYVALLQYISRFPYLLQDDKTLATTLEKQQWTKARKDVYMFTPFGSKNAIEMSIGDIRHELWQRPALLYQNLSIDYKFLTDAITIPYEKALEFVPNSIKIGSVMKANKVDSAKEPSVESVGAVRQVDTPAPIVPNSISPITPIYDLDRCSEIKKLAEDLVKHFDADKYIKLCRKTQWQVYPIVDLNLAKSKPGDWFKHEKVVVNTLSLYSKERKDYEVGIDYFFCEKDIVHYLAHFGCMEAVTKPRNYRYLKSVVDYSDSTQWSIHKRIKDIAQQLFDYKYSETQFVSYELLTAYLKDEKWSFLPNKKMNTVVVVPPWNPSQDISDKHREGCDYFIGELTYDKFTYPALITYILTNGLNPKVGNTVEAVVASPASNDSMQIAINDLIFLVADLKNDETGDKYKHKSKNTLVGDYMLPIGWHNGIRVSSKGISDEAQIMVAPWNQFEALGWNDKKWTLDTAQLVEDKDYILRDNIWKVVGEKHNGRISREDLFGITSTAGGLKRKIPIKIEEEQPIANTAVSNKKGKSNKVESADKEEVSVVASAPNKKGKSNKVESADKEEAPVVVPKKKGKSDEVESADNVRSDVQMAAVTTLMKNGKVKEPAREPKKKSKVADVPVTPARGDVAPGRSPHTGSAYPPEDTLKITLRELIDKTEDGSDAKKIEITRHTLNEIITACLLDLNWIRGECLNYGNTVLVPEWTQKKKGWNKTTNKLNTKNLTADKDYVLHDNVFDFVKAREGNVSFEDIFGAMEVVTESDGTPDKTNKRSTSATQFMSIASPTSPMTAAEEMIWIVYSLRNNEKYQNRSKTAAVGEVLKLLGWIDGYRKGDGAGVFIPPWLLNSDYFTRSTYTLDVRELVENRDFILRDSVWDVVSKCGGRVDELRRDIFVNDTDISELPKPKKTKTTANGASDAPELQLHHKSPTKSLTQAQETDSHFERLTNATSSSPNVVSQSSNSGNHAVLNDKLTLREVIEVTKSALNGNTTDSLIGRIEESEAIHNHIVSSVTSKRGITIYVCGSPGVGKTLTVSTVLDSFLCDNQYVVSNPETNSRERFTVCRVQGTAVDATSVYSELAQKLGIVADNEADAKVLVKNRFTGVNVASKGKRKSVDSNTGMTVVIIDEIDKASDSIVNELIACSRADESSLILIGIANTITYAEDKDISDTIVFSSYDAEKLKKILEVRYQGLASAETCSVIAKKLLKTNSDIRQLLQVGKQVLQEAVSTISDAVLDARWDKRDIITTKNVVAAFTTLGLGSSQFIQTVLSQIDQFARCLLVSLILDGKTTTNVAETVPVYNTYAGTKGLGTKSKDEVRELCEQLNQYNLLSGGPKRSSGRRADNDTCTYMVEVTAEQVLRCPTLENIHKESLQKYLNQRNTVEEDVL